MYDRFLSDDIDVTRYSMIAWVKSGCRLNEHLRRTYRSVHTKCAIGTFLNFHWGKIKTSGNQTNQTDYNLLLKVEMLSWKLQIKNSAVKALSFTLKSDTETEKSV